LKKQSFTTLRQNPAIIRKRPTIIGYNIIAGALPVFSRNIIPTSIEERKIIIPIIDMRSANSLLMLKLRLR
jgi:hypothetical protein